MSLIKCPECGYELSNNIETCPECGFRINQPQSIISSNAINHKSNTLSITSKPTQKVPKRVIGIVLIIISLIVIVVGVVQITNDKYKFYQEHYQDCLDGYNDCMYEARHNSGWFSSSYKSLADSYEKMMNEDNAEIWKYRIIAIVCGGLGITSFIVGIRFITKKG